MSGDPSAPTENNSSINNSLNHSDVPSAGPATSSSNPPSDRRSSSAKPFTEGSAFSISRLFGANSGAGFFGGVGNDVTTSNRQWLERGEYDAQTQQINDDEARRRDEDERLKAIDEHEAANDPSSQPPTSSNSTHPSHPSNPSHSQPSSPHPRLHLPQLSKTSISHADLNLQKITNPKIRAYLDPDDDSIRPQDLADWSDAELHEMVDAIEPVHLTTLIRKSVEWFATERCRSLSFKDVSLQNANGRYALRNVSGFLNPGQTVAILSAPDAGTTNLLNVLAGRQETGTIKGEILYDGKPRDESYARHVGYVLKDDVEFAMLTVKETLMFSAMTRTPYAPRKLVEFRVNLTMKLLGLAHAANTYIGDASIKGVSGGEKRRVSYGVEMVAGHGLVLGDLITNGLDSASAYAMIRTIRYINRSGGRSMMCSIVQPAPALYNLFDSVMLLSKGSCIYFGPTKSALAFVQAAGFVRPKGKSEPQFLEELTATPEKFYEARMSKEGRQIEKPRDDEKEAVERDDGKIDSDEAMRIEIEKEPNEEVKQAEHDLNEAVEMAPIKRVQEEVEEKEEKQARDDRPGQVKDVALQVEEDPQAATPRREGGVDEEVTGGVGESDVDEEVKEYTIGDEKVLATPMRMTAWKLLVERYTSSIFAERVQGVIEREKQRAEAEQRILPKSHRTSPTERTQTEASINQPDGQHADKLSRFTGSMGVIDVTRDKRELEMESRGPGGGNYRFNRTFAQQVAECIHRQALLVYRTPGLWFGSWVKASLMAIIAGTLFLNLPQTTDYGRTRLGLFFFLCIYIGVGAVEILAFLMMSRSIYYAQRKAGYFRGLAYYIAVIVSQIPLAIIETFLFAITVYGFAGLRGQDGSSYFWYFWLTILAVNLTSRCWVFTVATISPNAVVAFVIIPITNVMFVQFSGFLEPRNDIPIAWQWFNYVSFYSWAWRGLSTNELYNLQLTNTGDQPSIMYTDGNAVLQSYDIDNDLYYKWYDLLWLTLFTCGFCALGALVVLTVDWSRADTPQTPDFGEEAVARKKKAQQHKQTMKQDVNNKQGQIDGQPPSTQPPAPTSGATAADPSTTTASAAGTQLDQPKLGRMKSSKRKANNGTFVSHQRDAWFQWKNLNYNVTLSNGTERQLLTDCFGYARPGVMVALMGASGAGKSTLLDVLAGKKTAGRMEGEVLLNGQPFDAKTFNHTAAYGEQFDSHNAFSTVREAISFSALLRLPTAVTSIEGEVERRVMHVMDVLDLQHSANDIIGAPGFGGVSPEIRKKVTIAVELVMDPALIFLDEPTTGLDSAGAFAVMSSVKKLAQQMAVICTIHQPSNEIVHMFDWLLLLQPGGQVVYFGPVTELVPYFVEKGIAEQPEDPDSPDLNVADFALDAIRTANGKKQRGEEGVDMVSAFKESDRYKEIQAELDKNTAGEEHDDGPSSPTAKGQNANAGSVQPNQSSSIAAAEDDHNYASFPTQLYLLTQRNMRNAWRNRLTFKTRYFTAIVLGFVCGTLFFHLDYSQQAAQTRVSVLFVGTIIPMFLSSSALAEVFAVRPLYFREVTSRMYGPLPWFVARRLADVPFYVVEMTIFGTMLYWIAWMRHDNNGGYFFWFLFTIFGVRAAGSAFTQMVATAFASPEVASAFQSTAFTVFFLFAGFLIPEPLISNGWIWMFYLSFIRYPLDFLLANELSDIPFDCSDYPGWQQTGDCPVPNGDTILNEFGVQYDLGHRAINFVVLWIFLGGFLVLGFLALKYINHIKR